MTESRRWLAWLAFGCASYVALPWYALEDGFLAFGAWVHWVPADPETGPAPWQASLFGRPWLWGYAPLLITLANTGIADLAGNVDLSTTG